MFIDLFMGVFLKFNITSKILAVDDYGIVFCMEVSNNAQ